ncbi:MAG: YihY/virulence factor BrkB family protein [Chloroflexi bacterium]|nr:YihY/virulence factor BrkB family protein [Chloroflexota bacterium]
MNPKAIFGLFKDTYKDWSEDKASRLGAALAYYAIFSIGPLLLIAISIASIVYGQKAAQGQIVGAIGSVVGNNAAKIIQTTIQNANRGNGTIIATIIGIVTLLLGASGLFGQLQDALNTVWEVMPKPGAGIVAMVKERLLTFLMVLATGVLLIGSLAVSAVIAVLGKTISDTLPGGAILWQAINFLISLGIITLMFALLFKFLPDVEIRWKDVWLGAAVTALLFVIGQIGLAFYLGTGSVGTAFGAAGSLVIVLVWIYYSAQILFFGAEFTQVYVNKYGSQIKPSKNAEFITEEARAQHGMRPRPTNRTKRAKREAKEQKHELKASPWFK